MKTEYKESIDHLKSRDPVLSKIIDDIGECLLSKNNNYFSSLVRIIIHQQLSIRVANTIYKRFLEVINNNPSPEAILEISIDRFKEAGISERKIEYILGLSMHFLTYRVDDEFFNNLSNQEIIEYLTKIKGLGRWSAEMFLIFSMNRLDVLPLDDIGFLRALERSYGIKNISKEQIYSITSKWGPYSTIAVWYLWQSSNKMIVQL
ncbi:MAG TPA: DNA-3-methyladenine glycosylase [Methanofastidiosum sp.]|nr:DNA-3-methyladenine glycosylase [Methanofastidiosum sp.]